MTLQFPIRPLFTLRTDQLAGRRQEVQKLQQVRQALWQVLETRLFYIAGAGGMGKTRLLEWVRDEPRLPGELCTPIIDFYNSVIRADVDLVEQIVFSIKAQIKAQSEPQLAKAFEKFDEKRSRYRLQLQSAVGGSIREEVIAAFEEAWQQLAAHYRLIVLLDTAELLRFEDDEVRRYFRAPLPVATSKQWLTKMVTENRLPGVLFLVAGRQAEAQELYRELCRLARRGATQPNERIIRLGGLDAAGTRQYIDVLEQTLRRNNYEAEADKLNPPDGTPGFDTDLRNAFHHLTGGSPIVVAIALQLYIDGTSVELNQLVDEQLSGQPADVSRTRTRLREALVRALAEYAFGLAPSLAIRYMSLARKGLDGRRLRAVWEGDPATDLQEVLDYLAQQIFVKHRPDGSLVLHDEVADWVEEGLYGKNQERAQGVYHQLVNVYEQALEEVEQRIETLNRQSDMADEEAVGEEEDTLQVVKEEYAQTIHQRLLEIRDSRRNLIVDKMAYALRWRPVEGYKLYCELAEEAFNVGVLDYEAHIRAEFLGWWYAHFPHPHRADTTGYKYRAQAEAAGISAELIQADFAIRALQRQFNDPAKGVKKAVKMKRTAALAEQMLADPHFAFPRFARLALHTYADTARGQLAVDEQAIQQIRQSFQQHLLELRQLLPQRRRAEDEEDVTVFLTHSAVAFAYYELGFFERSRGNFEEAIENYSKSAKAYRDLHFEINQARSLNDKAYVLAMVGDAVNAEATVLDALNLRRRLGFGRPIALSYNTYGVIATMCERPISALHYCKRARQIFFRLGDEHGQLLAGRALSEAYRRDAERLPNDLMHNLKRLEAALHASEDAARLAERLLGAQDPLYAEILDEYGCVYRDLARFCWQNPDICQDSYEDAAAQAEKLLNQSVRMVQKSESAQHQRVDSEINLAYLYYYHIFAQPPLALLTSQLNRAEKMMQIALSHVPERFRSPTHPEHSTAAEHPSAFWAHLSKAYVLLVLITQEKLKLLAAQKPADSAVTAAEDQLLRHLILILYYTELFPGHIRAIRRARQVAYNALKTHKSNTLERFAAESVKVSEQLGISGKRQHLMRRYLLDTFGVD